MAHTLKRRFRLLPAAALVASTIATSGFAQSAASSDGSAVEGSEDAAQAERLQCVEAHQNAQQLKLENKFVEAREFLRVCSRAACPGVIIKDCGAWMADLDQATPSMVFQVTLDGSDAPQAKIEVDGVVVEDRLNAVPVNPGQHTIVATLPNLEASTQTISLPAGQRMRLVSFSFESKAAEPAPIASPPTTVSRPTPVAVYPFLGLGIAGLAAFGVLTGLGMSEQSALEDGCSPNCTDDDLSKMKTMYLIGDISAGVGAAALVTAGIIYLARPEVSESVPQVSFSIDPQREAFGFHAWGSF